MKHDPRERVAELADRHGRMVFATAYRILGDPDDAEDALQDVFLKLLSARNEPPQLDAVRDWGAYLRVAASRSAIDLLRRRSGWERNRQQLPDDVEDPSTEKPGSLAGRRQKAEALRQAMTRLSGRDAQVFALRYFEDSSYEEIARQMDLSVSQVGVILHRARKRLRDMLEPLRLIGAPAWAGGKGGDDVGPSVTRGTGDV